MVFASGKSAKKNKKSQAADADKSSDSLKGSLTKLFRRKNEAENLPAFDVKNGLTRAMKAPKVGKKSLEDEINDQNAARLALTAIEAALYAMDKARDIITQCLEITNSAKETDEPGARALFAESYDELRLTIEDIAHETDDTGKTLIGHSANNLEIEMKGRARYAVASFRIDTSAKGLNLTPPGNAFADAEEIDATLMQLQRAHDRLERATASYCRDAKFLMSRVHGDAMAQKSENQTKTKPCVASGAAAKPAPTAVGA